uniref:Little elongation complex subunit 1 C-terminal domain-containing protein n=1 Tax=Salarias fasciatus TaxID=181472 RepID=A0A672FMQ0_SALFA
MDIDDNEKETHPTLTEDRLPLEQEESFHTATPLSSQKNTTAFPAEEDTDSPMATNNDSGHISNETGSKHLEQSVSSSQMKDKMNAINENGYTEGVIVTEPEPASAPSGSTTEPSASLFNGTVVIEPVSVPDSLIIGDANSTSGAKPGNSTAEVKQDQSESLIKMDLDTNHRSDTDARTVTPADGESLKGGDATAMSSEALPVSLATSSPFTNDVTETDSPRTERTSDGEKSEGGSAIKTQKSIESSQKDQEMAKVSLCAASDHHESNEMVEQRTEIIESAVVLAKENGKAIQETAGDGMEAFPIQSNGGKKLPSPMKSPLLKEDQEHGQAIVSVPSKNLTSIDTMEIEMMEDHGSALSDLQEKQTLDCQSSKENADSPCTQLSPTCGSPTIKSQTVESETDPSQLKTDANSECISNKEIPVPISEKEATFQRNIVQDFHQDGVDSGSAVSFNHNAAPTHKQKDLESCAEKCKEQGSDSDECKKENKTVNSKTECMSQILSEVGSPLPPLLTPLLTPPKMPVSINPRHAIGKLLFPSPMDTLNSPLTPVPAHLTPNGQQQSSSSLNSPVPPNGVPSSPLQFGSATPKHAVPVPGRLPVAAVNSSQSSSTSHSQENSMRILDSMYPELSARARTLSILRGNVGLAVGPSDGGSSPMAADSQVSSFKTLNSTSTAFTNTVRGEKRPANSLLQPVSKCLRLDSSSADAVGKHVLPPSSNGGGNSASSQTPNVRQPENDPSSGSPETGERAKQNLIVDSLKKIESQCFDLMPVIRSHLHVGNLPKKPVLRDEEKEVISEICISSSVNEMILAILNRLKTGKRELSRSSMQALCRVYTGICRQKRDHEKARLLAYSILTEDFPECSQLVLFIVTTWPTVLSHSSSLCQAIHTVTKLKATDEVLSCLSPFLGWEKSPPCDIDHLISRTLSEIQSGVNLSFTKHSRYGDDLDTVAWERVLTLHLLCSHKKWKWTYEHLLGKEVWPIMNTWVTQPRDQQEPVSDVTVATVLRLIGCLCQLGLKEKSVTSVATVANVINTFGQRGHREGVPWEVQLAAVYCIYDVSPCNPKHALDALAEWRGDVSQSVPPAVTSCINQLASICRQVKH